MVSCPILCYMNTARPQEGTMNILKCPQPDLYVTNYIPQELYCNCSHNAGGGVVNPKCAPRRLGTVNQSMTCLQLLFLGAISNTVCAFITGCKNNSLSLL